MRPLAQRAERIGRNRLSLRHRRAHGQFVLSPKRKSDAGNDAAIRSQVNRRGSKIGDCGSRIILLGITRSTILDPRSIILPGKPCLNIGVAVLSTVLEGWRAQPGLLLN